MRTFTQRFNEIIKVLGVKPADIARECGVTRQAVHNWRQGASIPNGLFMIRFMLRYEIDPEEFAEVI